MRKLFYLFLVLLILFISLLLPLWVDDSRALDISSQLFDSLASMVTLAIALLLYSRYDIDKSLKKKQSDVVLKLLKDLRAVRFLAEYESPEGNKAMLQFFGYDLRKDAYQEYLSHNIRFDYSYMENLSHIWQYRNELLLPPKIAKTLSNLVPHSLQEADIGSYISIRIPQEGCKEKRGIAGVLNNQEMCFKEFLEKVEDVFEESKKWLDKNANEQVDFNF